MPQAGTATGATLPQAACAIAIKLDHAQLGTVCATTIPTRALRRHRLTVDRYKQIRDRQGGTCAVCRRCAYRDPQVGAVPLYVDHDHDCCPGRESCGRCVRGLLCSGCNGTLGELELWGVERCLFRDQPEWLAAAHAYLARPPTTTGT